MKQEFNIKFPAEQGVYLQRLGTEVDSKAFLIDRMLSNHANDEDTLLFDSIPFKHYHKEYEKSYLEWETAKKEFENVFLKPEVSKLTGVENPVFTWAINDFLSEECIITME